MRPLMLNLSRNITKCKIEKGKRDDFVKNAACDLKFRQSAAIFIDCQEIVFLINSK